MNVHFFPSNKVDSKPIYQLKRIDHVILVIDNFKINLLNIQIPFGKIKYNVTNAKTFLFCIKR